MLAQFAEHCRREGYADGSIVQEAVEEFLYGRHLKASTIRREEIILRELAEHARQFGWPAWAPPTLTRVKKPHRPPPYVFSDEEIRRLFHVIDTQPLSEMSNRALVDPVLFRVFYATGLRRLEALNLELRDFDPARATLEIRDGKNHENRLVPVTRRLAATLDSVYRGRAPLPRTRPQAVPHRRPLQTGGQVHDLQQVPPLPRRRRHPAFPGRPAHPFAASRLRRANLRRWAADGADLVVMLPYLSAYMGHADLRGTQYYLQLTADAHPEVAAMASARFGYVIPGPADPPQGARAVSRANPAGGDLAGRWLSRFLTSHLAAERDVSAQTIASYRDAIRLLLTWFRDVQAIPPEKLRLADIDRARVLGVPGLAANRTRQLGGDPQPAPGRYQVVRPLHRHRAARVPRPGHPDHRHQAEEDPGYRHGPPHRRRGQSPPGRTRPSHPARAARHGPALHALRHRRPRPGDLRPEHLPTSAPPARWW